MRCTLLFCLTILNVGKLKTESIDFSQKEENLKPNAMLYSPERTGKTKSTTSSRLTIDNNDKSYDDDDQRSQQKNWNEAILGLAANFNPFYRSRILLGNADEDDDDDNFYDYEGQGNDLSQFKSIYDLNDDQLSRLTNHLIRALKNDQPIYSQFPPIVVTRDDLDYDEKPSTLIDYNDDRRSRDFVTKRARPYMQYPWKRHNSRAYSNADYDACSPSKHDVFALLTALHEVRQGNKA